MRAVAIKRAYEPPSPKDGTRILVDRLWPRGAEQGQGGAGRLEQERGAIAGLCANGSTTGPSASPNSPNATAPSWRTIPAMAELRALKGKVTLVYGARDPAINHAVVLARVLKP